MSSGHSFHNDRSRTKTSNLRTPTGLEKQNGVQAVSPCLLERETLQNIRWMFALQRPERSGDLEPSSPGGARKHKKDGIQSDTIFLCFFESARRDSNPRPRPWQGRAPPTEPLAQRAGDGNRTHISSLEGWCSTTELHPQVI